MLGLQKYSTKLFEIKWDFNDKDKQDLEGLLFVEFEKQNNYFIIKNIQYTYFDILLGIEEMEFILTKTNDDLILKIIKI